MHIPEIDIDALEQRLAEGALLFDVRDLDEYETVRIAGVQLIPLAEVPDNVEKFPTDQTIYIICAQGGRSARAVEFLNASGADTVNVVGGMNAWSDAGKPTEPTDAAG